jgi:glycosyltransferase involved in cell wall biosynthesis
MGARVTVVIPAWDAYAGSGLLDAVASVERQRCPHQLIVVDNASRTPLPPLPGAAVLTLGVRVSAGASRNAALPSIATPYVVFLDADDELLDGALELLVGALDHASGPAAVLAILDAGTGRRHRTPRRSAARLACRPPALAIANAIWSLLPTQGATIMRVDAVRACGGYADRDSGEDWVLGASLTLRGPIAFDSRPALRYRARADSPGNAPLRRRVLLGNATAVRARLRSDPAAPAWLRTLVPGIAVAQTIAALVLSPATRRARTVLSRGHLGGRIARRRAHEPPSRPTGPFL